MLPSKVALKSLFNFKAAVAPCEVNATDVSEL